MIINEDYFNDLEITDKDIEHSTDSDSVHSDFHMPYASNVANLEHYLNSKYKSCIMLDCWSKMKGDLWNVTLPKILNKMDYVLNVYDIDYEYILTIDDDADKSVYDIHGFTMVAT